MAGPYSHVIACQMASGSQLLSKELRVLLNNDHCFLLLGSVSPDLPSIWDKLPLLPGEWSDKMHRGPGTNRGVIEAFHRFQAVSDDDPGLAWLLGYVGHVVADVVVHPVVAAVSKGSPSCEKKGLFIFSRQRLITGEAREVQGSGSGLQVLLPQGIS